MPPISIHALLAESDIRKTQRPYVRDSFLSTLSLRRATLTSIFLPQKPQNFYPRSPCGERQFFWFSLGARVSYFYPRSPCGERLLGNAEAALPMSKFLSTLSLRRATSFSSCIPNRRLKISIHALLAESDSPDPAHGFRDAYFYPRSPCGERPLSGSSRATVLVFLSTLSLRRATTAFSMYGALPAFLSTLSLRRATACQAWRGTQRHNFYPRSPCGERRADYNKSMLLHLFLSTLSLRRATGESLANGADVGYFYPRSPCGERLGNVVAELPTWKFLSTLSLRRATSLLCRSNLLRLYFYPRSPCGERQSSSYSAYLEEGISIHALLAESDKNSSRSSNS